MTILRQITLPELESRWKWPRLVNPHLGDIEQECLNWSASFGAFDRETQDLIHTKGKLNLLAGQCYARMTKEQLRSGCDMMHLFFMFDEYSDKSEPAKVWEQARIQIDVLSNPHKPRPKGEWIGGEIARQFWLRIPETSTDTFRRRFIKTWDDYVSAVARQADHRSRSCILDVDEFFLLRRDTSGAPSTIALIEMDLDIPHEIRYHPTICEMETLAVEIICIANDVVSFNKEQAVGDDEHSIITVVMKQYDMDIQAALDKAGELSDSRIDKFNQLYLEMPRYLGPVDLDVQKFVDGMAQCVSGVMHWAYESQRYFGKRGLDVKKTRKLYLLPKVVDNGLGPVPVDDSKI